jgi:hypothetical protein
MTTRVSAVEARRTLGKLLNIVSLRHEEIVIERAGKEIAMLSPCGGSEHKKSGKLDLRKAYGLGKDLWKSIGAEQYVKEERKQWD